jgi:hypothetical protein
MSSRDLQTLFSNVLDKAPTYLSTVGGGSPQEGYAVVFADPSSPYTFIPDSVLQHGLSTPSGYTYWFPTLLNKDNYKSFFGDATRVDLSSVSPSTAEYVANKMGQSTSGYLIPSAGARFDSEVRTATTESLGGGITGLGQDQSGNLVYGLNNGRISADNEITLRRPQSTSWFQDLAGGITDIFTGLGPIAPFLLNLAAPGIGTAVAVGLNLGKGNIEGAITSGAMGMMGQGIASAIRPEIASAFAGAGLDAATTKLLTDATIRSLTAGTMAGLTGGDVSTAMQNAALNAGFGGLTGLSGPTQADIDAIMNLGGTPEQQLGTALLEYHAQLEKDLGAAQDQTPQDIYPIDIPQTPPTSYETGIGLPGEEAAAQSQGGFGGTGNILGLEDYEEVAGKALAEAQAQAGGPDVYLGTQEPPNLSIVKPSIPSLLQPGSQTRQDIAKQAQSAQQSYNQMLDQYLASQPVSVPFIADMPTRDLEEMFSGQTPIYWQGQA